MTYPSSNMTPFDIFNDHENLSETEFLKNSIATHTKYGSTTSCFEQQQNYHFITHYIDQTDTLQGLALRYGCKIENIKKYNKLFSDDNNHLRSRFSIVIPVYNKTNLELESDISSSQSSQSSLDVLNRSVAANNSEMCNSHSKHSQIPKPSKHQSFDLPTGSTSNFQNSKKTMSLSDSHDQLDNKESLADFLIRIDSSIAKTKNQVENFSKRNNGISDRNDLFENENKKSNNSILFSLNNNKRFNSPKLTTEMNHVFFSQPTSKTIFDQDDHQNDHNSYHNVNHYQNQNHHHNNHQLLPYVKINNKKNGKIKSSLKRLEKSQEEIYEL